MSRTGIFDKPDANQQDIVEDLRALGYYVRITKRPVDLWVVEPTGQRAVWVEVKSRYYAPMTQQETDFFNECPSQHRIVAVTIADVARHFEKGKSK
jgi:hypothetical protein